MPKIENCSWGDFVTGNHRIGPIGTVAIQIVDPGDTPPEPAEDVFQSRHLFEFLDAEVPTRFFPEEKLISDQQAEDIASILIRAFEENHDVLVHCVAGACRSGAVVEVAEMVGFTECPRFRLPNARVKSKLMSCFDLLPSHKF
jgi:protein-tyrosine phosphatase